MKISLDKVYSGKVRDLYRVDERRILMVASDRLSAFDVIFDDLIPSKGVLLTKMSNAWFSFFENDIPNHLTGDSVQDVLPREEAEYLSERAVVVKKLTPIKIEAVVRGYIAGGGWKEYQQTGMISGIKLPAGLQLGQELPEPIFTPSTKAEVGEHDRSIDFTEVVLLLGEALALEVKETALKLYQKASEYACKKGIIIADTKFEFGLDDAGVLTLMDEVLTPDSSRFWEAASHQIGREPFSLDKQYVRNWLEAIDWDKQSPPPSLPTEVIIKTQLLYQEIYTYLFN